MGKWVFPPQDIISNQIHIFTKAIVSAIAFISFLNNKFHDKDWSKGTRCKIEYYFLVVHKYVSMLQPDEAVRGYAKYFLYHHFFNGTSGKIVLFNLDFFLSLYHNSLGGKRPLNQHPPPLSQGLKKWKNHTMTKQVSTSGCIIT